jgi:hypothetical protein
MLNLFECVVCVNMFENQLFVNKHVLPLVSGNAAGAKT